MKNKTAFYPALQAYIDDKALPAMGSISEARQAKLREIAGYLAQKQAAGQSASLVFICTHNSRRSHFGQIWAATAAAYYGLENVHTFSGGTEATAFNPRAVAAAERAGFQIDKPEGDNPHYKVHFADAGPVMDCYSKVYDDPANPSRQFAALMTCSDADENCPVVLGAELRASIPYNDPKEADDTPLETQRYDERCRQIASEMFFLFSTLKS